MVHRVNKDHQDHQDCQANEANEDLQDQVDHLAQQDQLDLVENLAAEERLDHLARMVLLERGEKEVPLDPLVKEVLMANQVHKDLRVPRENVASKASLAREVLLGLRASLVRGEREVR